MKYKFIQDNSLFGIDYDWGLIEKEYKKLPLPDTAYKFNFKAIRKMGAKYLNILSKRGTGKTTAFLLVGLVMHKLYGTIVQYLRQTEDETAPSFAEKLVEVIRTYNDGEYVKQLTDGQYNDIYYHWKQFFYCLRDENGNIIEKSDNPIIQVLSIDKAYDYKSSYNAPLGDWIIVDEYIGKYYRNDAFVNLMDLLSTIIRKRKSPTICLLANTLSVMSPWFEEFEISRDVREVKKGEGRLIITSKNTRIYFEIYDPDTNPAQNQETKTFNELFFGFRNPKLSAITGDAVFNFEVVPHIPPKERPFEKLTNNIYIDCGIDLLKVDFCIDEIIGLHARITKASRTYDDSIILSIDMDKIVNDKRYLYGLGHKRLKDLFNKCLNARSFLFSTNEVGAFFKDYLSRYEGDDFL